MRKILLFPMLLMCYCMSAQRTQIGSELSPPANSGMQTFPLFYVDTASNSYYSRPNKTTGWTYNHHPVQPVYDTVLVTVHDTVYSVVHDTVLVTVHDTVGGGVQDTLYVTTPLRQFLVPENFGATNTPSNGATASADAVAWQKCIDEAAKTGKAIYGSGNAYYINRDLIIPLNIKDGFYINGNWSKVNLTGSNGFIKRENPADNSIANTYIKTIMIENFVINGTGSNTVFDINSTFSMNIEHMSVNNVKLFGKFRFCLQGLVNNVRLSNYKKFAVVTVGDWKGTSAADGTSGSNSFKITNCRVWGTADTAIYVYGSSGFVSDNMIIEGDMCNVGFYFNSEGVTTAKDFRVRNTLFSSHDTTSFTGTHFECRGGVNNALFVIKGIDYVAVIDGVFGQYAGLLCDGSSTSGSGHINIVNIPYWLPLNGKMFKGNKNKPCSYSILECNVAAMRNNFPGLFIGDAPSLCNAPPNCGYFKFAYWQRFIPR